MNYFYLSLDDFHCDFYLPERNTIIEVSGPSHYIAPSRVENQTTDAKHRVLRAKGYKVINIPYFCNEGGKSP